MSALADRSSLAASSPSRRPQRHLVRWLIAGLGRYLLLPACVLFGAGMVLSGYLAHDQVLYDFRGGLYDAGVAIVHGASPYWPRFLAAQAALMRSGHIALGETALRPFSIPVYPAPANLAMVPLSLLPLWLAGGIYTLLSVAAMLGGLWLLGVRDWRCLLAVSTSYAFLSGLYLGAVGPFLVLGAGVAWRWRARLWPPALAVASLVAVKVFPWTLGGWLLVTRRYRALAVAVAGCLALTLGAWAAIGWHGLVQYPQMLSEISFLQEGRAVSVVTVLVFLGVSPGLASAAAIALAVAILGLAWRVARRPAGDRRAFALAIIAALAGTPIVWEHYMVLLFVPVALVAPRYSRLWLVPVLTPIFGHLLYAAAPLSLKTTEAYSPSALCFALPWLAATAIIAWRAAAPPAD